jgi:hypothetical protein
MKIAVSRMGLSLMTCTSDLIDDLRVIHPFKRFYITFQALICQTNSGLELKVKIATSSRDPSPKVAVRWSVSFALNILS